MNSISIILTLDYLQCLRIVPRAHPSFLSFFLPLRLLPITLITRLTIPERRRDATTPSKHPSPYYRYYLPSLPPFPSSHYYLICKTLYHSHKQPHPKSPHPRRLNSSRRLRPQRIPRLRLRLRLRLRRLSLVLPPTLLTPHGRRPRALLRQQRHGVRQPRRKRKARWSGGRARALLRQKRHRIRRHPGRERKRLWRGSRAREAAGMPLALVGMRGRPVQG